MRCMTVTLTKQNFTYPQDCDLRSKNTEKSNKVTSSETNLNATKPIAVTRSRPLVGSLPAIVAAILWLAPVAFCTVPAPVGPGIMYLEHSDGIGGPIHDWDTDPALTNPYCQGIALRTQWVESSRMSTLIQTISTGTISTKV